MIPRCKWCDTPFELVGSLKRCGHCDRPCDDNYWTGVTMVVQLTNSCPKCYTVLRRHYQ